ncbi:MAG: hypothetical protein EBV77_08410 [Gemmatimonadaceae bacterium]|nr:hypothetical protein [Gemmatimonadaceae bacterium]
MQFTIERAADSALGSPRRGDLRVVEQVSVQSPWSVEIRFTAPQPELPVVLAELPLAPRHLLDTVPVNRWRTHAFATAPVGNGPFRFVSRLPGRLWRFARNEAFPVAMGGPPRASEVVVAVVDEAATKFAGLVSGELDVAGVSPTMARLVRQDPSLRLLSPPALFSTVLAFNTTRPPGAALAPSARAAETAGRSNSRCSRSAVATWPSSNSYRPTSLPAELP